MAEPLAAPEVSPSDLESYQHAVRLVLTHDIITASRPTAGALKSVLYWADQMSKDFHDLLGYQLEATAQQVRLIRRLDTFDGTQRGLFATKTGRPFDRRRLAYLCLILASFQRAKIEIDLVDLVRSLGQAANAIDGLGFDATITEHKRAVVDVADWLVAHGALRLDDGDAESWALAPDHGDALYWINHDICASLFRPPRPLQYLDSARGLLETDGVGVAKRSAQREAAARQARRLLVERPVVYYGRLDAPVAVALRSVELADNLARFTGLQVERRAEGVALVDSGGRFTDRRFPGRGGAVNRAAGLMLAKMADLLEDPDTSAAVRRVPVPDLADDLARLTERIDQGRPGGSKSADPPTRTGPAEPEADQQSRLDAPLVEQTVLAAMMSEIYDQYGSGAFTEQWKHDPDGLLTAALTLLDDLELVRRMPGGLLFLPAAARYRNIKAAFPRSPADDGQTALDISHLLPEGTGT
ncbi:MAG TPA: DUF2398 family protein [Actinocrinis sp.]|nr:DUF2398 family protein [Actinocrinis sp.]